MSMKDDEGSLSVLEELGMPFVKISRRRSPSNPSQQVEDVHYDVLSAGDMAKALHTKF